MYGVRSHSFVPGWAQFQKHQPRRAWTYIAGIGVGIVGGATFAVLSDDAETRRDRSTIRITRDHYDDLANQRFWTSRAFYVFAGSLYVLNLLDGITVSVAPYQVLTQDRFGVVQIAFAL